MKATSSFISNIVFIAVVYVIYVGKKCMIHANVTWKQHSWKSHGRHFTDATPYLGMCNTRAGARGSAHNSSGSANIGFLCRQTALESA